MATKAEELRKLAQTIKNEKQIGGNTAERVGNAFLGVANALDGSQAMQEIEKAVAKVQQMVDNLPVTQQTGDSTTSVMSQKAVTNNIWTFDAGTLEQIDGGTENDYKNAAINAVPDTLRKGGMTVLYTPYGSNKKISISLNTKTWSIHEADWSEGGGASKDAVEELKPYTFYKVNIKYVENYLLNDYKLTPAAGWYTTEPIPVVEGHALHIICQGQYGTHRAYAFYGSDKKSGVSLGTSYCLANNNKTEIVVPSGAAYIRLTSYAPYFGYKDLSIGETMADIVEDSLYSSVDFETVSGAVNSNGENNNSDDRWRHTSKIKMSKGEKFRIYLNGYASGNGTVGFILFDATGEKVYASQAAFMAIPEEFIAPYDGYFMVGGCSLNNATRLTFEIKKMSTTKQAKKRLINKNIHTIGHSFWVLDGMQRSQFGKTFRIKGYQTIFMEQFNFLSFDSLAYDGNSLGATSATDGLSIALKMDSWTGKEGDIWTLDTMTNDFKRNIPLGALSDFNDATGATTYYGALRAFADKIEALSISPIVIVANACRRNNDGYTSVSKNTKGAGLADYSNALANIAAIKGWYFVNEFDYGGITDDNLNYFTLDGLHPNNLGFSQTCKPWIQQLEIIYNRLL